MDVVNRVQNILRHSVALSCPQHNRQLSCPFSSTHPPVKTPNTACPDQASPLISSHAASVAE
eukprot:scaffold16710_cov17-Tisochrysis_lutea.AAC.1